MASSNTNVLSGTRVRAKTPAWRIRQSIVTYVAIMPYVAFAIFPLYMMLITSLMEGGESDLL